MSLARQLGRALLALACFVPAPALAGSFDTEGRFSFAQDAVYTQDFEQDLPRPEGEGSLTVVDEGALLGERVLALGAFEGVDLPVELPKGASNYRVRVWVRGDLIGTLEIRYGDNPHPGVDEITALYPTGRMTSDGWVEVGNDAVPIDGTRQASVTVGFFAPSGGAVDALELRIERALAPNERSGAACSGPIDPVACGPSQVCQFGQCRHVRGWVPPIPANRDDVAAYLAARIELLFGPFLERQIDLPHARVALARMATAGNKWSYWNAFTLAVRLLRDGHTGTSSLADFVLENEKPLGLCFIEGEADLSWAQAPADDTFLDVLVSHTGKDRNLGLVRGDRLLRVDGKHPIDWARGLTEHHWSLGTTSDRDTHAELAEQLRSLVARYARTIEVVRCDPASSTCGAPETIDLATLPPITPDEPFERIQCDNRPLRHLADSPADHIPAGGSKVYFGQLVESDADERIWGAEWDSLYTSGNDGVAPGLKAAVAAFEAEARGVVLDHRTGNGGTILGPDILWRFAVPRRPVSAYFDRQRAEDEMPSVFEGYQAFQVGLSRGMADFAGSNTPTTLPVALLITRDVSASDWLPLGLKGASPNVRIFGPFETNGAFSTRYYFGYWLGITYSMATGDTFDPGGRTLNGRGVEPDVVVRPRQSDLLVGRDSVFEAALAWIREELAQP